MARRCLLRDPGSRLAESLREARAQIVKTKSETPASTGKSKTSAKRYIIAEILQQLECAMGKCYKRCFLSAAEQSNTTFPSRFIRGSASSVSEIVDVYDELVEAA